ncbi:MAG: class I SAM-dependent methyltransferase [Terriglobia bacterium]
MRAGRAVRYPVRAVEGFSLAALRTLLVRGPGAARKVVGETLRAATPPRSLHLVSPRALVRGFSSGSEVRLKVNDYHPGTTTPLERFIIAELVLFFKPAILLEVGTYRGSTTRVLLDHTPGGSEIYTVDLPVGADPAAVRAGTDANLILNREVGVAYKSHPRAGDVVQILGSTFDDATWQKLPNDFDFIFIDASHSYEAVRNDTARAMKRLSKDGIMLWHDYIEGESQSNGVGRLIRELMATHADVLRCEGTQLAMKIPSHHLQEAQSRMSDLFRDEDYRAFPWLRSHSAK